MVMLALFFGWNGQEQTIKHSTWLQTAAHWALGQPEPVRRWEAHQAEDGLASSLNAVAGCWSEGSGRTCKPNGKR